MGASGRWSQRRPSLELEQSLRPGRQPSVGTEAIEAASARLAQLAIGTSEARAIVAQPRRPSSATFATFREAASARAAEAASARAAASSHALGPTAPTVRTPLAARQPPRPMRSLSAGVARKPPLGPAAAATAATATRARPSGAAAARPPAIAAAVAHSPRARPFSAHPASSAAPANGARGGADADADAPRNAATTLAASVRRRARVGSAPASRLVLSRGLGASGGLGAEFAEAAEALLRCDFLLVGAGAGFSADSGLAVYKDIAAVPAWREAGLTYSDLCVPSWLETDPSLFFGFWGSCYNTYMQTPPHPGYALLARWRDELIGQRRSSATQRSALPARWCDELVGQRSSATPRDARPATGGGARRASSAARAAPRCPVRLAPALDASARADADADADADGGAHGGDAPAPAPSPGGGALRGRTFVFTSNVDTAFARAGLGGRASLYEIHGNIRTWQCSGPCPRSLRAARADGDAPGTWQLPASHRFAVELGSMRAPATRPAAADAGGGAEREAEPNHVSCAHCGRLARPAILMFDDERCIETAPDAYEQWEARVLGALRRDPSKRLVILEGGCGPRVPTVRRNSERLLKATAAYGTKLIRINLDFPDVRQALARHCVPIRGRVLPALEMIDRAVCARLGIASVARPSGPPSSSDSETLTVRLGALRGGE